MINLDSIVLSTSLPGLPRAFPGRPRVEARIKAEPEDFVVEEIPAYEPSGAGEHIFLFVEKRDVSGGELLRRLARALRCDQAEIGMAGAKDRRAVTRQWLSVPSRCDVAARNNPEIDGVRILSASRHGNKLRTGHLKGNRFSILLRGAPAASAPDLAETARLVEVHGFSNLFGDQRFSRENLAAGIELISGRDPSSRRLSRFERRMFVSAVQGALFNRYVAMRQGRGLLRRVLDGDVMEKAATGGLFVARDQAVEQVRLEAGETGITGPIFGHKMFQAESEALALEAEVLDEAGLSPGSFRPLAGLAEGTRRPMIARPASVSVETGGEGVTLSFFLPKGCYATVLLREFVEDQRGSPGTGTE